MNILEKLAIFDISSIFNNQNEALEGREFYFYLLPILITIPLVIFTSEISSSTINILITIFAILTGLLLNLLLLVFDINHKLKKEEKLPTNYLENKKTLTKYIFYNISFALLISIILMIILILYSLDFIFLDWLIPIEKFIIEIKKACFIIKFVIFYFITLFAFNLLIILRKVFCLIEEEVEQ